MIMLLHHVVSFIDLRLIFVIIMFSVYVLTHCHANFTFLWNSCWRQWHHLWVTTSFVGNVVWTQSNIHDKLYHSVHIKHSNAKDRVLYRHGQTRSLGTRAWAV